MDYKVECIVLNGRSVTIISTSNLRFGGLRTITQ